MYLLNNIVSSVPSSDKMEKFLGKMTKFAFLATMVFATMNIAFPGVFAANPGLEKVISFILNIIYVIMVFVGIILLVVGIMSFVTSDPDNGPARTKATYQMAGAGLLIALPVLLNIFPFSKWVADQMQELMNVK